MLQSIFKKLMIQYCLEIKTAVNAKITNKK